MNAGANGNGITLTIGASVTQIPVALFAPYANRTGSSKEFGYKNPYIDNEDCSVYAPNITSIVFEAGSVCKTIGEAAFMGCKNITTVTIADSVETIGGNAFLNCTALTNLTLGNGVTSIGYRAFNNCSSLTNITIPNSVTSIDTYAFQSCTSLLSATIGSGVTSIGTYAFKDCFKLVEVYDLSSSLTITTSSEDNGYAGYYAKNIYTSANTLSCLITQGDYIFYNDSGTYYLMDYTGNDTALSLPALTISSSPVNIPDSVTTIGNDAFRYCSELTDITIGSGVTSIGTRAFYECIALTNITIPDSVTSVGIQVFYNCILLTSVTFDNTSGWYVTKTENAASGDDVTLTSTSTNADYLTDTYKDYYWYRTNS